MTEQPHRIHRSATSNLVTRTDRYGKPVPPGGTLSAYCTSCHGFSVNLPHDGRNRDEVEAELDRLVREHVDGTADS